jgi:hypothetical protein
MNESPDSHNNSMTSWKEAPTRRLSAGGVEFAYRQLGPGTGVPVVFLTHLAAVLDNWDPRVVDGVAAKHRVITFDNRGVGASSLDPSRDHGLRVVWIFVGWVGGVGGIRICREAGCRVGGRVPGSVVVGWTWWVRRARVRCGAG